MSDISKICPGLAATITQLQEKLTARTEKLNGFKPEFFETNSSKVQAERSQEKKESALDLNNLDRLEKE